MKVKFSILTLAMFLFLCGSSSFTFTDWVVPAKYEKMKNPHKADNASLKMGKSIYNKHCKSCHGSEGLGDGSKAAQLDTPCGDFSTEEFQAQSDGALFYKSRFGKDDMPNFEKKIPYEEDIWHVINYIRTFIE